jgi:hypothetical protein
MYEISNIKLLFVGYNYIYICVKLYLLLYLILEDNEFYKYLSIFGGDEQLK